MPLSEEPPVNGTSASHICHSPHSSFIHSYGRQPSTRRTYLAPNCAETIAPYTLDFLFSFILLNYAASVFWAWTALFFFLDVFFEVAPFADVDDISILFLDIAVPEFFWVLFSTSAHPLMRLWEHLRCLPGWQYNPIWTDTSTTGISINKRCASRIVIMD